MPVCVVVLYTTVPMLPIVPRLAAKHAFAFEFFGSQIWMGKQRPSRKPSPVSFSPSATSHGHKHPPKPKALHFQLWHGANLANRQLASSTDVSQKLSSLSKEARLRLLLHGRNSRGFRRARKRAAIAFAALQGKHHPRMQNLLLKNFEQSLPSLPHSPPQYTFPDTYAFPEKKRDSTGEKAVQALTTYLESACSNARANFC
jgi:hypothetical protein